MADRLPLVEAMHTIQGEGAFQGHPAYFIRLGGCDVGCTWCDTKHSWPADAHPAVPVEEIARQAAASGASIGVVTGGEPTLYDLTSLTAALRQRGLRVHLETAGVYRLTGDWDWICLSPKKFKAPLPEAYTRADELKVIVYHKSDLDWAQEQASRVSPSCALFLQPEWSRQEAMTPLVFNYIHERPGWRLSTQLHKHIGIP